MGTNKSAEVGPSFCTLSSEEIEVLRYVFETILNTEKAPTLSEMQQALKKPEDYIIHTLDELERRDILLRKRGTQEVVSIYPLSLVPTDHQIVLRDGKKLFAMCAVDALGMPIMFHREAKIVSRCAKCRKEITIEAKDEEIALFSHHDIMIWHPGRQAAPQAENCCPLVNFFCSKEHLKEWKKENPCLTGKTREINQAFQEIKQIWRLYGETLGLRQSKETLRQAWIRS